MLGESYYRGTSMISLITSRCAARGGYVDVCWVSAPSSSIDWSASEYRDVSVFLDAESDG